MLTQERLKELLHYDPVTGLFTWRDRNCIAGCPHNNGYIYITIEQQHYSAHQLAFLYMLGYNPELIDHKDLDTANNKWLNLRDTTRQQNAYNTDLYKHNTSGVRGVCWCKKDKKWRAYIRVQGKQKYLGSFDTKIDAARARLEADKLYVN